MDLSPRPVAVDGIPRARSRRKVLSIAVLVVVLGIGGFVITKFLTTSLDYYCNADEIGRKSGCEAGRSLRIQGVVDKGSIVTDNGVTTFKITFNNVTVPVIYDSGEPGGLFQECIPVVVHGIMRADVFEGDEVEVKHGSEYDEENKDRIAEADQQAATCSQSG